MTEQRPPDIWDFSRRLRRAIMTREHIYFGWKCVRECGNWKVLMIKKTGMSTFPCGIKEDRK